MKHINVIAVLMFIIPKETMLFTNKKAYLNQIYCKKSNR